MARKIKDITHSSSQYDMLSQTPKNYDKSNYYLKTLQDKVNADWRFRPNRVDVEYEESKSSGKWLPLNVVIQTVKQDTGNTIANDYCRLVFKNIFENRFKIGDKFRIPTSLKTPVAEVVSNKFSSDINKDIWIAINTDKFNFTSSMVIERCNGILGSIYTDDQGIAHYHYEPVVQERELSNTSFSYGTTSVIPGARFTVIAQYNRYTSQYKTNQRFIVGAREEDPNNAGHYIGGQVYKINAINKFYGNSTFGVQDVGLVNIYLEITESSPYDDWDNMIAYQDEQHVIIKPEDEGEKEKNYSIKFKTPAVFPSELASDEVIFTPVLVDEDGVEVADVFTTTIQLENWPASVDTSLQTNYVVLIENTSGDYYFSLKRERVYTRGDLIVTCVSSDEKYKTTFKLVVKN